MAFLLVCLAALLAAVTATPSVVAPLAYAAAPVVITPAASQFHVQDALGQYSYGYSNPLSAKSEARAANGVTVGGYKYLDGDGKVQSVEYSSDANGFQVAASNLPVAPAVPEVPPAPLPVPVKDTPEVVEARSRHLATVEEVKTRITQVLAAPVVPLQPVLPLAPGPVAEVKTASSATVEATSTAVPVVEAQPAPAVTAPETNSTETPAIELRSALVPASTLNTVLTPSVALAPSLAVRTIPAGVAAPLAFGYSFNTIHGINSIVQPGITTYSFPFGAPLLAAAAPTQAPTAEAAKEAKESSD